jgi:hypothetical protein
MKDVVLPSPTLVWERYNEFCFEFDAEMKRRRYVADDISQMPVVEYIYYVHLLDRLITANSGAVKRPVAT